MKYVSLVDFMHMYGCDIKKYRVMVMFNDIRYLKNENSHQAPLDINMHTNTDTGQRINNLKVNMDIETNSDFNMPPILEIEWFKCVLDLGDDIISVLEQLGYMVMALYRADLYRFHRRDSVTESIVTETDGFMEYMERHNAILEVEDLVDTPDILSTNWLNVELPKIRAWQDILAYGNNFIDIFNMCTEQSNLFMELYIHMPFMLAMFMLDYCKYKLSNWSKQMRLRMENAIRDKIEDIEHYVRVANSEYTYTLCTNITENDVKFVSDIFMAIYDKIHELNTNIGTISYSEYMNIERADTIMAKVRLSNMNINWNSEMNRVEREKKQQSDQEGNEDDG